MRSLSSILFLLAASVASATGVVTRELDPTAPVAVPVHEDRTLTVMFPGSIAAINGAGFTPNPETASGEFLFFHQTGAPFFSIVPLPGAMRQGLSRNLNIVYEGSVYVLMPMPVQTPKEAWATLTFTEPAPEEPPEPPRGHPVPVVKVSEEPPEPPEPRAGPAQLMGMLDTVRMFSAFDIPTIEDAIDIMPEMSLSLREEDWSDYGGYAVRTDMVMRNEATDTLGFAVEVHNKLDTRQDFEPNAVAVRSGDHTYISVLADMKWSLGAGERALGYFIIGEGAKGAPNLLDVGNAFKVILTPVEVQ